MKLIIKIAILQLIISNSYALTPHSAKYELSINDINIAQETRILTKSNNKYLYSAKAKTTGFIALFKDYKINANSVSIINENGINSLNYKIDEKEDDEYAKQYNISIDSKKKLVQSTIKKKTIWSYNSGNIVDPLSVFLATSYDLQNNPNKTLFSYQIANGKKIGIRKYKKTTATIKVNDVNVNAIVLDEIFSKNNTGKTKIYFLKKYQYLPVFIEKTKDDDEYIYKLIKIRMNNEKEQKLKITL